MCVYAKCACIHQMRVSLYANVHVCQQHQRMPDNTPPTKHQTHQNTPCTKTPNAWVCAVAVSQHIDSIITTTSPVVLGVQVWEVGALGEGQEVSVRIKCLVGMGSKRIGQARHNKVSG